MTTPPLLQLRAISKSYKHAGRWQRAVSDVSLDLVAGETLGIVGESGSGKTTLARMVVGLQRPDAGEILWQGQPLPAARTASQRRQMTMVFQNPTASLNPRMRVQAIVAEPLHIQGLAGTQRHCHEQVVALLAQVGMGPEALSKFPHELSGGQRQRVALARALSTKPRLVVADEPLAALDLSVAAQVANVLMDLQQSHALTYLLISHDLAMVAHLAHRIAVMHQGRLVETGLTPRVLAEPQHPYTKALLASRLKTPLPI